MPDANISLPSPKELRETRERFERLLRKPKSREPEWQSFFKRHPYVFSRSLGLCLNPGDFYALGRPGKSEPDFVFYPEETTIAPSYGVIELKRPTSKILTLPRRNIVTLSRSAATAVSQGLVYSEELARRMHLEPRLSLVLGNSTLVFVIMGLTEDLRVKLATDLVHDQVRSLLPSNCRIVPYDTLFEYFSRTIPPAIIALSPISDGALPETGHLSPEHIVIVEDDAMTTEWIIEALRARIDTGKIGIEVFNSESDFREKYVAWRGSPAPLFVLDVMLRWAVPALRPPKPPPDSGGIRTAGFRCADLIRRNAATAKAPILFHTVHNRESIEDELKAITPPLAYVQKGSSLEELASAIDGFME